MRPTGSLILLRVIVSCVLGVQLSLADCGCSHLSRGQTEDERKEALQTCEFESSLQKLIHQKDTVQDMVYIPTSMYTLGTDHPVFEADLESPEREALVEGFYIDKFEVSNQDFQAFADETNYITEAEQFGDSFVFGGFLDEATKELYKDYRVVTAEWWYKINGTNWRHPLGADSTIDMQGDLPVVHVSWNDAKEYCQWRRKRLPTENEWEAACRGKKSRRLFPWGSNPMPKDTHYMNIWQGDFPTENTVQDGYYGPAPVHLFRQNEFGVHNIVGNVWEWVEDHWDAREDEGKAAPNRVKKGGSYLCHKSYCYRYRCAARSQNTQDSSAGNLGFRCARSE